MLYTKGPNQLKSFAGDCLRSSRQRLWGSLTAAITGQSHRLRDAYNKVSTLLPEGKAVIVCNGPSLTESDIDIYSKYPLVGLNFGSLALPSLSDHFVFHVFADYYVVENRPDDLFGLKGLIFIKESLRKYAALSSNLVLFSTSPDQLPYSSPSSLMPAFGNSTALAVQILFYAGATKVGIIGLDHDYGNLRPLAITSAKAMDNVYAYKANCVSGKSYQAPDLLRVEYHLRNLRYMYEDHGRVLLNCSARTKLATLPRMSLLEFDAL